MIKAYNNIVVGKLIKEKELENGLVLPEKTGDRFVKIEVLDVGQLVDFKPAIKPGDKVIANNLFEIFDMKEKIGFINSKDILAKYD